MKNPDVKSRKATAAALRVELKDLIKRQRIVAHGLRKGLQEDKHRKYKELEELNRKIADGQKRLRALTGRVEGVRSFEAGRPPVKKYHDAPKSNQWIHTLQGGAPQ